MRNFETHRAEGLSDAVETSAAEGAMVLAGGTTMIDLLKIGVMEPDALVDITGLSDLRGFEVGEDRIRFGALARMAEAGDDPTSRPPRPR